MAAVMLMRYWDSSADWSAAVGGYRLPGENRLAMGGDSHP